ncbi:MAG: hypothetical protein ACXV2E_05285 [Halobacteriota archaeon]
MRSTDKAKVAVVIAACLIGLTVVLKNVLNIPADVLSQDIVFYVIIYGVFFVTLNFTEEAPQGRAGPRKAGDNPWVWSAVVILVTLAIIAVNAIVL